MDTLEEDLTCSVCYGLFSDPRVLPCSHTFCRVCLDNVLQLSGTFSIWRPLRLPLKCPNCRSVVELPPAGVDALPTNVSLRAIIEKYQKDSQPRTPSCPEHPRQPLNVYCVQDRQLICGLCLTVGGHQGHAIDDLQAAYVREKTTPGHLLARLSDQRWTQICELGEHLEQEKSRCAGLVRKDRVAVEQYFQRLEQLLAKKREAFLGELDQTSLEVSQAYDPLISRVKELQEKQLALVSLGSSVAEEECPLVFLENVHLFRERVEALVQTPLPSVTALSITPRAAEYLEEHWHDVMLGELEDAPVPRVWCCAEDQDEESDAGDEERLEGWVQELWLQLLVGLLLLLLAALWINPVGGASLSFSFLSRLSQLLHGLGGELSAFLGERAGLAYKEVEEAVERGSAFCSALWGDVCLQFEALCSTFSPS